MRVPVVAMLALVACGDKGAATDSRPGTPTDPWGGTPTTGTDTTPTTTPCVPVGDETCDGTDEDCDGVVDDGDCSAPAATHAWFLGGSGVDHVRGIAVDDTGTTYVCGGVTSPAVLDGPVANSGSYVAALDPSGAVLWSRVFGNSGSNYAQDVSVAAGIVCLGGAYDGVVDFGGGPHTSAGNSDAFVVCLDAADGTYRWDRVFGAGNSDIVEGVRVADDGDLVVSGEIGSGANDFGGGVVADASGWFVARYGDDGAYEWVHTHAGVGADFGASPGVAPNGDVVGVAHLYDDVDFGGGLRSPASGYGGVVVRWTAAGAWKWDLVADGAVNVYGADVQADGSVVIGGDFSGPMDLGGAAVESHVYGNLDVFAASFTADGVFRWQYTAGGVGSTRGFGVDVAPNDDVVLAAGFTDTSRFGDVDRTSAGQHDLFVVGLTADGGYRFDVTLGQTADETFNAVAADPTGGLVAGGEGWGNVRLAGVDHPNVGSVDGLVVWFD